uniref:F-box domain-containing protein n=1 Tax=Setaria italica TaxID=4555 RepID=K4A1T3_SETIT
MSPPQRRSPVPPDLMDEILGEILLRIPPEEPAHLIRFALVCKPWLRVLSDPAFRRGYRERHRRPPLLGFVHNLYENGPIPRFVPTTASRCSSPVFNCQNWWALDSRHGRVLVNRFEPSDLVVWDPVSGDQQHLPLPPYSHAYDTGAQRPILVVFVGTDDEEAVTWASMYSSETRGWSAIATADFSASTMVDLHSYIETKPSILIGNALYFSVELGKAILKYDLAGQGLSVIDAPEVSKQMRILMAVEDGGLGFAAIEAGVFTIEIKSEKIKKVGKRGGCYAVLPYMSFCAP